MKEFVYAAFGDSITDGYGVARGFVSFLAGMIQEQTPDRSWALIQRGMSGETSLDGLYRLDIDVVSHDPDLVTINFGVNDAFSGISPQRFASLLQEMVARIQEGGCRRPVLLSSEVIPEPMAERQVLPYWDVMRDVAAETGAVYADVNGRWQAEIDAGRNQWELIIPGDLHPNEEGHRFIADVVFDAIVEAKLLAEL